MINVLPHARRRCAGAVKDKHTPFTLINRLFNFVNTRDGGAEGSTTSGNGRARAARWIELYKERALALHVLSVSIRSVPGSICEIKIIPWCR